MRLRLPPFFPLEQSAAAAVPRQISLQQWPERVRWPEHARPLYLALGAHNRIGGASSRSTRVGEKKKPRLGLQSETLKLKLQLKQQSPARRVIDCQFSNSLDQSRKNCQCSTASTMNKEFHDWPVKEQLYLIKPFATEAVRITYLSNKMAYREAAAIKMNGEFGGKPMYVQLDETKVHRKFRHFAKIYKEYQKQDPPHVIPDLTPDLLEYEQLEIYIARYGGIFAETGRSSAGTSSTATGSASRLSKKKQDEQSKKKQDEHMYDIQKEAQIMVGHCTNDELSLYLCALLQFQFVLVGFRMMDDIPSKKKWLDDQVLKLNNDNPNWWNKQVVL